MRYNNMEGHFFDNILNFHLGYYLVIAVARFFFDNTAFNVKLENCAKIRIFSKILVPHFV